MHVYLQECKGRSQIQHLDGQENVKSPNLLAVGERISVAQRSRANVHFFEQLVTALNTSFFFYFQHILAVGLSPSEQNHLVVQAIHPRTHTGDKKQALYKLFAAYIHTMPLEELMESVERARLDAKLRYVVIYGAACSYCLSRAERLDGSYLRTFAFELKEQLAQTLAAFVTSILTGPHRRLDAEEAAEPPLRQIIDVLQQVMCTHDAEKLAISVLEIYKHR